MSLLEKECRICFESDVSDNNQLIVPCKCNGSSRYIHRKCLDTWRETNISTDAFYKCRECHDIYTIEFIFTPETHFCSPQTIQRMFRPVQTIFSYIYVLMFALFYRTFDNLMNNYTLDLIFVNKSEKNNFLELAKNDSAFSIMFYFSFITVVFTILAYSIFFGYTTLKIKRKWNFWKQFGLTYGMHFLLSCHFYYIYWIFNINGIDEGILETYINSETLLSCMNFFSFSILLLKYNNTIIDINKNNKGLVVNREEEEEETIPTHQYISRRPPIAENYIINIETEESESASESEEITIEETLTDIDI